MMNNEILFKYSIEPTCNFLGGDTNTKSICIFTDGSVIYEKLTFKYKETLYEDIIPIGNYVVKEIEKLIENYWEQIFKIPRNLDNGSMDGEFYHFQFKNKKITALNIQFSNINEIEKKNSKYYNQYKKNIEFENTVIQVFNEICVILKKYGVKLI